MPKTKNVFFILSCARSGSTSITTILDLATNGMCALEPMPNLNVETREMMEGRLDDPISVLRQAVFPRVAEGLKKYEIYGEKNVTYGPFIQHLYAELECRFVFLKRDGRDVVRSLIDWHNRKFGTIYRECTDPGDLTPTALAFSANLPIHLDSSDYARPRPMPSELIHEQWENLSRFEMCAYYWQRINNLFLDQLNNLPKSTWITIDYTAPKVSDLNRVIDFLGLKGITENTISDVLQRRINSLKQRGVSDGSAFPRWTEWPNEYCRQFSAIAGETMIKLGYDYHVQESIQTENTNKRQRESNFGDFWKTHDGGHEWYIWMYNYRIIQHQAFQKMFQVLNCIDEIETVADFGCGTCVGYVDFFKNHRFHGFDLAPQAIDWCQKNYTNPQHAFRVLEIIKSPPNKAFDLVFSQGTIDNTYNMNAFLRAAVKASKKWIYLTAYRGFFHQLRTHRYEFNQQQGVYYNDISPTEAYYTLLDSGCSNISIYPSPTGYKDIPFETVIVAHV